MAKESFGRRIKMFLSGRALSKESAQAQLKYIAFIVFLLLLVISHRYASEKTLRSIDEVKRSIKELRASSIAYDAELMRVNRPSLIKEKVEAAGMEIHSPSKPPMELKVEKIKKK
ncbi:MAG: FtsL-like putative cell division protein [Mangrovibacterium sp.]